MPTWHVVAIPTTIVGGSGGDVGTEPNRVTTAHLLRDGSVVIANGDPLELRLYSSAGKFVRRIGHQGHGPGEFDGTLMIFGATGDSLLTYNGGNARWELFTPSTLVREWPAPGPTLPIDLLLFKSTFTTRGVNAPFACVRAVVDRIPGDRDALRQVFPDGDGRFWTHTLGADEWVVYSLAGKALGRVPLPSGTELLEVSDKAVVVKTHDADDIERIEVRRVAIPANPKTVADPCRQVPDSEQRSPTGMVKARLQSDLRNMQSAGQAFFAKTGAYPKRLADFGYTIGPYAESQMLISNAHGWGAKLTDREGGIYCITFAGEGVLPGWPTNRAACGWISGTR